MRLVALLLAAALLPAALAADAPSATPAGRAYASSELAVLLDGLGYPSKPLDNGGRLIRMDRPGYAVDVHVLVAGDGGMLLLYAPLRQWPETTKATEDVLVGLLKKSAEYGPSRFYLAPAAGGPWIGLLRSVDNRAVEPVHVRENLDFLFEHVRASEDLWNPERWPGAEPPPLPPPVEPAPPTEPAPAMK